MNQKVTRISFFITILLLSLFIKACAVSALPKGKLQFGESSQKGLLVGSVTFTSFSKYDGYFFRLTNNSSDEFQVDRNLIGQLDRGTTHLFVIERPEGKNEIPSIRLFHNSAMIAGQYDSKIGGFSIPYEIKKGEITYIGNIVFDENAPKGEHAVTFRNNFDRDLNELKKLQPDSPCTRVKNDLTRNIE
jgi:hypothetical protein